MAKGQPTDDVGQPSGSPALAKLRDDVGKSCALLGAERNWFCAADEFETAIVGLEAKLAQAVAALQAIYARHHMAGDGSAGKVSGDALRALGVDLPEDA